MTQRGKGAVERRLMVHMAGSAPSLELHVYPASGGAFAAPDRVAASMGVSEGALRAALYAADMGWTPLLEEEVRALPPIGPGPAPATAVTTVPLPPLVRVADASGPAASAHDDQLVAGLMNQLTAAKARIASLEQLYERTCKDHQIVLSAKDAMLHRVASTAPSASAGLAGLCAALRQEPDRAALTDLLRSIMDAPEFVQLVALLDETID